MIRGMFQEHLFSDGPYFIMIFSFSIIPMSFTRMRHLMRSLNSWGNNLSVVNDLCVMNERELSRG